VILCTYNRRSFVLATLASLRSQTLPYRDFEVIVVDNGSRDGTLNAVRSYIQQGGTEQKNAGWRVRCLCEPKHGLAYARNTGLLAASGRIAVFLDDDTLIDAHMLEHLWQAYQETGADAIGMHVTLHWDMACPHWMVAELLETLGYFSPDSTRCELPPDEHFASSAFSVKREILHAINYVSPFLSKRSGLPACVEVADLCLRLRQQGYRLWYEPAALVMHRATSARLHRAFFVGRAYWQGRSEIMQDYCHLRTGSRQTIWQDVYEELRHFVCSLFLQGPLIRLAGRSTTERLLAAMEQSHRWGRLIQRLLYLEHAPSDLDMPAVCLIHAPAPDVSFGIFKDALDRQEVRYFTAEQEIPLRWLWQHRRYQSQMAGILHFYRPGALQLTRRQSQRLLFRLWLARRWGLCIITTDDGGWWQSIRGPRFRQQRAFERKIISASHAILCSARQASLLYRGQRLHRRVCSLPQPGFRGLYPPALPREEAHQRLGLPSRVGYVYLCLAHSHSEREILFLLETFRMLISGSRKDECQSGTYLLLVSNPMDCQSSSRIQRLLGDNTRVYTYPGAFNEAELPVYMGACDAQVLPHLAVHTAGSPTSASLALSYRRLVIAPDLPRFSGLLPPRASVPYVPASRESLAEAMIKAQQMVCTLQEAESRALDLEQSWNEYARKVLDIYRKLLGH
jgi:GT2 family glycosyltransferase